MRLFVQRERRTQRLPQELTLRGGVLVLEQLGETARARAAGEAAAYVSAELDEVPGGWEVPDEAVDRIRDIVAAEGWRA